ncbi:nitroreductase [Chitinophaga pinensis DSM 2588]|uniref:Nitroreductase n=2 Tax=Chitinophaga pinensis TaxID=79329 RepID=A0A979G2G5_CHIPD|nr:nitroreductase [Chitinophaga pinensis DSM 2588]
MSLVKSFEWRYATKKYDTARKVDPAVLADLTETVRLAPSSFGLQPYKFLLIEDKAKLEEISRAAHGQPQITTGAHVMVLAVETDIDEKTVASYIDKAAIARQTERKNLEAREQFVNTVLSKLDYNQRIVWAEKQAFLAVGVFVSAAAEAGIDGVEVFYQTVKQDDPNTLVFFEVFKSQQALKDHLAADYTQAFFAGVKDKLAGKPASKILKEL